MTKLLATPTFQSIVYMTEVGTGVLFLRARDKIRRSDKLLRVLLDII